MSYILWIIVILCSFVLTKPPCKVCGLFTMPLRGSRLSLLNSQHYTFSWGSRIPGGWLCLLLSLSPSLTLWIWLCLSDPPRYLLVLSFAPCDCVSSLLPNSPLGTWLGKPAHLDVNLPEESCKNLQPNLHLPAHSFVSSHSNILFNSPWHLLTSSLLTQSFWSLTCETSRVAHQLVANSCKDFNKPFKMLFEPTLSQNMTGFGSELENCRLSGFFLKAAKTHLLNLLLD